MSLYVIAIMMLSNVHISLHVVDTVYSASAISSSSSSGYSCYLEPPTQIQI